MIDIVERYMCYLSRAVERRDGRAKRQEGAPPPAHIQAHKFLTVDYLKQATNSRYTMLLA